MEYYSDVYEVLEWFKENGGGPWSNMSPEIEAKYDRCRSTLMRDHLLDNTYSNMVDPCHLISDCGLKALEDRSQPEAKGDLDQKEWSDAMSFNEWRKYLDMKETTMRSHIKKGTLVGEKLEGTNLWRFTTASLQRYKGRK